MRRLILAAAAATFATNASAQTMWQGDLFITEHVAGADVCEANRWPVGEFLRIVFKPAGLPGNGPHTMFSLVSGRNAQHYQLNQKGFVNGTYKGNGISGAANYRAWQSVLTGVRSTPAPDESRPALYLKMTIANFFDHTGCKVTLEGAVGLRQ